MHFSAFHFIPLVLVHDPVATFFLFRYHHNAYFTQQVGVVVRREALDKFKDFIQLIFDNQDSEYNYPKWLVLSEDFCRYSCRYFCCFVVVVVFACSFFEWSSEHD